MPQQRHTRTEARGTGCRLQTRWPSRARCPPTPISTRCASTRSARWRWTRCRRPSPAIPARRWRWRRSPTRCGRTCSASTRRTRPGRTATASCSASATPRCCSTRCCTCPARKRLKDKKPTGEDAVTLDDIKQFRQLGSVTPGHPEYSYTSGVETTTGPLGQGCGNSRRHGDGAALARRALQQARLPALRLPRLRALRRRRHDGGRRQRGGQLAGHLKLVQPRAGSTTATTSPSRARPAWPSARTWAPASPPTAGTCCMWTTPTTRPRIARAARGGGRRRTGRRMIVVHSIIGYGAPKKAGTREAHGEPLGDEEIKAAKRVLRLAARTRNSWCRTGFARTSRSASGARGARLRKAWMDMLARYRAGATRTWRASSTRWTSSICRTAGTRTSRASPPTPKGLASRDSSRKVLNAIARACRG